VAQFEERFKAADKNGDGALTKAEAEAGKLQYIAQHFDKIDANKDGKVTREELRAGMGDKQRL
jgi:Ca2+-binding EF-hand superfamily protein